MESGLTISKKLDLMAHSPSMYLWDWALVFPPSPLPFTPPSHESELLDKY
ncbi:hypothetical protein COO91_01245 [Nostoc flagelliforme CCNUN1]|uniref:Uncharacterized protein n=1 Tax=Nostoc flagelliforme CCNUN1 TaxID=2038116 RepID=A0A2K8SIW0_9NOSO|nr:hypothetical protein COO91_01245 [Nostoc flagelliforme CCNUN1]